MLIVYLKCSKEKIYLMLRRKDFSTRLSFLEFLIEIYSRYFINELPVDLLIDEFMM